MFTTIDKISPWNELHSLRSVRNYDAALNHPAAEV